MNNQRYYGQFILRARIFAVLFAGIFLIPPAHAQEETRQAIDNRFLLIFDTSADMKKRVPMVQKALDNLFVTSMDGQLQPGNSIGVWTFDQNLRLGQAPLQYWVPAEAATMTANIASFVGKQHYGKTTHFEALQPLLNQVVEGSERLTVLIFCDGEAPVNGTPYDAGINQMFQQRLAAQKKARQPFIIVMRAQFGRYVGCTVDFPPDQVDFPDFPPLPEPPPPPAPTNQAPVSTPPPPAPSVVVPSLIIVGTNVNANVPANPPPPAPKPTNAPPPIVPVAQTNVIAAPPTNIVMQTNILSASSSKSSGLGSGGALAIGGIFSIAAAALGIFVWFRIRKTDSSLITRSMNDRK